MIGTLLYQYLQLFDKAKIHEIKKVKSLQKHIINYISGYLRKLQQSSEPDQVRKAILLQQSEDFVCVNLFGILIWAKAIKRSPAGGFTDGKTKENAVLIDHDETKIKWLMEKFYSNTQPLM